MIIAELISLGIKYLKKYSPTPILDTEILLQKALKKTKEYLYIYNNKIINNSRQIGCYKKLLQARKNGQPIAYLINKKEFYGLDFYVNNSILIPRPETELIIDEVIKSIKNNKTKNKLTIADIGTGSGCIAVTLAKCLKNKVKLIYATDISNKALAIARKNAQYHQVSNKIKFLKGSLLEPLKNRMTPDILIANLPYLSLKNRRHYFFQSPGLKYEPSDALFTKQNGWYWYQTLLNKLIYKEQKPKLVFLEIDPFLLKNLGNWIKNKSSYFLSAGWRIKIIKDLKANERVIKINID